METRSDQIAKLEESANNLSALSQNWMDKGEDEQALTLSNQAVLLRNQISILKAQNRTVALGSAAWGQLSQHMDALNMDAENTGDQMQDVLANVQTAKTMIGLLGKIVALV